MRENPVKRQLQQGGVAIGTMVMEFNSTGIGRLAAEAGADFVLFDMEHTGWSMETMRGLVAATAGTVPLVRVPATEYHFMARVLDVGAMGLMVPMVHTAEQAGRIAEFCKYPPTGRRGAAFGVAHDGYTGGDVREKMASANEEVLLIAQIESPLGVENAEAIAATDGIDILWIGHFDLTNFMGIPAQFEHPDYLAAIDQVGQACERQGKALGQLCTNVEEAKGLLARGFRCLAYGLDIILYKEALGRGIDELRDDDGKTAQ